MGILFLSQFGHMRPPGGRYISGTFPELVVDGMTEALLNTLAEAECWLYGYRYAQAFCPESRLAGTMSLRYIVPFSRTIPEWPHR